MRVEKRMKKLALLLLALIFLASLAACAWGRPGPRPPRPPRPPHYDPSLNIWIDLEEDDDEDDTGRIPYEPQASGVVTLVPFSPSRWTASVDLGENAFEMAAPLSLPVTIRSADVASIRAIFSEAVDGGSVDTIVGDDFGTLYVSGRPVRFGRLSEVELVQMILERVDGVILVQNLKVGLRHFIE